MSSEGTCATPSFDCEHFSLCFTLQYREEGCSSGLPIHHTIAAATEGSSTCLLGGPVLISKSKVSNSVARGKRHGGGFWAGQGPDTGTEWKDLTWTADSKIRDCAELFTTFVPVLIVRTLQNCCSNFLSMKITVVLTWSEFQYSIIALSIGVVTGVGILYGIIRDNFWSSRPQVRVFVLHNSLYYQKLE